MASPNAVFTGTNAQLKDHSLLARVEGQESIDILLAPVARDVANSTTTYLRQGLVLVRLPAGTLLGGKDYEGYYVHFLATGSPGLIVGQDDSSTAVILKHDHDLTDQAAAATADGATYTEIYSAQVAAYSAGNFWQDKVISDASFFLAAQLVKRQRLNLMKRTA